MRTLLTTITALASCNFHSIAGPQQNESVSVPAQNPLLPDETRFHAIRPSSAAASDHSLLPDETRFHTIRPSSAAASDHSLLPDETYFHRIDVAPKPRRETPVSPPVLADETVFLQSVTPLNNPETQPLPDETVFQKVARTPRQASSRLNQKQAQDAVIPILPPLDLPESSADPFPDSLSVYVKNFQFSGNTVFTNKQLESVISNFGGRNITGEQLEDARTAITRLYVDAGYINSGATLPDQDVTSGTIHFSIVEGALTDIELSGNRWFRSRWLLNQLRKAAGKPVNFYQLRTGLQLLRQNPTISQINAELKPGAQPGESILHAIIKDESPFKLDLELSNKRPPSVGEGSAELHLADLNLLGFNDPLDLRWGIGHASKEGKINDSGVNNVTASYEIPLGPWDTVLGIHGSKNDSNVVDETFSALDITSRSIDYGLSLRQPVLQTLSDTLSVTLSADRKHSDTYLLGQPFTLAPGAINGKSDVFVTHISFDWIHRTQTDVLALRSSLNLGFHAFGSTVAPPSTSPDPTPDSQFTAWLGQSQYIRRLFDTNTFRSKPKTYEWDVLRETTVVIRTNAQLSFDTLLSTEQFSLGGSQSVRGYRENQLLRDNGLFTSLEFRIPVWMNPDKSPKLSFAPFVDYAHGWDSQKRDDASQDLASAGLGFLLSLSKHAQASLYLGHPFLKIQKDKNSLQDYGIHFAISISAF